MPLSVLIATVWMAQSGQTPQPFISPFVVAEPRRMALTPNLDGKLEEEEWDELSIDNTMRTYLNWEPGRIFAAAKVPAGSDLIVSFDMKANGWLVGSDNIEVRVNDRGAITARRLDATNPNAPVWKDMPEIGVASKAVVAKDGASTIYEVALDDPATGVFDIERETKFAVRFDAVAASTPPSDPIFPRIMAPVQLAMWRAAGLPNALHFNPEGQGRITQPGQDVKIRFAFNGNDKIGIDKFGVRSEGLVRDDTSLLVTPFPLFDNKGRTFIDYQTPVRKKASFGWRIARGTLTTTDGLNSILQMSYRVAPPFDIDLIREVIKRPKKSNKWRTSYTISSNSNARVEGSLTVTPPEGFRLTSAADTYFSIYSSFGRVKKSFDMEFLDPKPGTYPVTFKVTSGGITKTIVQYVKVEG